MPCSACRGLLRERHFERKWGVIRDDNTMICDVDSSRKKLDIELEIINSRVGTMNWREKRKHFSGWEIKPPGFEQPILFYVVKTDFGCLGWRSRFGSGMV